MKKIISTVAALAVVAAMGATAMAAGLPSPTTTADITATPVSLNPDYYDVEVLPIDDSYGIPSSVFEDLTDAVAVTAGDKEVAAIDVVDVEITVKSTGEDFYWYVDEYNPVTVAFAFDGAENVIAVLELIGGQWVEADFEIVDGEVVATLNNAYIVSFVTEAVKADEPAKDDGKGSAQTGYGTAVYAVATLALAAGAVFFFATGKKTAKDVK